MPEWMIQTQNLSKRFPCSTAGLERECLPLEDSSRSMAWKS